LRSFPCVVRGHVSSWCAAKPSLDNVNGSFLFFNIDRRGGAT
jgi:hypothetical protein